MKPIGQALFESCYMLTCPGMRSKRKPCGYRAAISHWDAMGACEGQAICPKCSQAVDIETGRPGQPCGECDFCQEPGLLFSDPPAAGYIAPGEEQTSLIDYIEQLDDRSNEQPRDPVERRRRKR